MDFQAGTLREGRHASQRFWMYVRAFDCDKCGYGEGKADARAKANKKAWDSLAFLKI